MAAPNMTPTALGQQNLTGDRTANFLKVFAGEVLTAFAETTKFLSRHSVRSITSGKSAAFPVTWKGDEAAYHTPGVMIVGGDLAANEKTIVIDSLLVAPRFIASIDEAMSHFDYRAPITRDIGMTLGRFMDKNVARVTALAARASASVGAGFGGGSDAGSVITSANSKTVADTLIQAIFDAVTALDQKNVPDTDRFTYLAPTQYNLLVNSSSKLIHRDYGNEGNGSVAAGEVLRVAGTEIVKSNNLPLVDDSSNTAIPSTYRGNFSTTTALVAHKEAVGTVKLVDLAVEIEYLIQNQGWLTLGKYACGHGVLRPECAVEIKTG